MQQAVAIARLDVSSYHVFWGFVCVFLFLKARMKIQDKAAGD